MKLIHLALVIPVLISCAPPCTLPTKSGYPEAIMKGEEKPAKDRFVSRMMSEGWTVEKSDPYSIQFTKPADSVAHEMLVGDNPKLRLSASMVMTGNGLQIVCRVEAFSERARKVILFEPGANGYCKIQAILDDVAK